MYQNGTSTEKFTYNGLNQLVNYENTNGNYNGKAGLSAEYKYMANSYRVSKKVNDLESRYLWDKDNIVADMNGNNVISHKYYRGVNLICDDSNNYYMHDSHGNIIETYVKDDNYCYNWYRYNAFGTNKHFDDTDELNSYGQPWGYCDQYYDWETQKYYMRARYYNPASGRFITEDTHWTPSNMIYGNKESKQRKVDVAAVLKSGNLYVYCENNPSKYKDTDGNVLTEAAIIVAVGSSFVSGITTGAVYKYKGERFAAGFVNGFTSCAVTELGAAIGMLTQTSIGATAWMTIGSVVGGAIGSVAEDVIFHPEKNSSSIAKSAAKSAASGIVSGVSSAYWKYAIDIANQAGSAAKTLMKYDENFGKAIQIFFDELVTILTSYKG